MARPENRAKQALCKNCNTAFEKRVDWKEFCTDQCRKEFWKHGGLSFRRMKEAVHEVLASPEGQEAILQIVKSAPKKKA